MNIALIGMMLYDLAVSKTADSGCTAISKAADPGRPTIAKTTNAWATRFHKIDLLCVPSATLYTFRLNGFSTSGIEIVLQRTLPRAGYTGWVV